MDGERMKFTGICYNEATGEYVAITQDGEIWSCAFYDDYKDGLDLSWKKLADAPEEDEE